MLCCAVLTACSLSDLVTGNQLPANGQDPNAVKTANGALGAYNSALVDLALAMADVVPRSGLFTDELQYFSSLSAAPQFPTVEMATTDARMDVAEDAGFPARGSYNQLQRARAQAREAIGALRKYHPTASPTLVGELFAIEGISEVLLAELYCSGIPLSTLDFEGDFTLESGSRSTEVYLHAVQTFDSALAVLPDSAQVVHFANVGRARALLALADYAGAARTVAKVPTTYTYELSYNSNRRNPFFQANLTSISDKEGQTGLPFRSSRDPRTLSDSIFVVIGGDSAGIWFPRKYLPVGAVPSANPGTAPIVLASGIEARLIEAEAALALDNVNWFSTLNTLRTTCVDVVNCPSPAPAGTGGVAALPVLEDPGLRPRPVGKTVHDVRVDLLFQERAYWLFLTGHRQGDLRRLVRQYNRDQSTVYPIGAWGVHGLVGFGSDVTLPVPPREQQTNPLYRGCFDREA